MLLALSLKQLVGETIDEVSFGNPHMPSCGSYGAYTVKTKSGRTFVIWQSYGEVNLTEVME